MNGVGFCTGEPAGDNLLFVLRVHLGGNPPGYTFIAVFREPGGYAEIMSFIEERQLHLTDAYWSDWESDYPKFTQRIGEFDRNDAYTGQHARA